MSIAIGVAWVLGGLAVALFVGRAARIGDEREGVIPARLSPRAGQYAAEAEQRMKQAAPAAFTALLAVLVLLGVGAVQDAFGVLA